MKLNLRRPLHGLLVATVAGMLAAPGAHAADLRQRRPNILFILADDLGWTDLGVQGSKFYETPNIDRLATQGMRFTHGYTCGPNCQPTRAALLSGQYGPRTGVYTVGGADRFDTSMRPLVPVENVTKLAPEKVTFAEALKQAGYVTGMFGKWHLALLALADATAPKHQPLDGVNLLPLLISSGTTALKRDALYWHFPGYLGSGKNIWRTTPAGAIRVGDFKLLEFFEDGRLELYNVREDVGQKHDLAKGKPDLVRDLHAKLKAWRKEVNAPMPEKRKQTQKGQASKD
jgi:arylsulfatase A-like enzyme